MLNKEKLEQLMAILGDLTGEQEGDRGRDIEGII